MRISEGNSGISLIECLNPRKQVWVVRWGVTPKFDENGVEIENSVTYCEEIFNHKPLLQEIQDVVIDWYNTEIDKKILTGFTYEGNTVWLSDENQRNYESGLNQAIRTNGKSLPEIYKFGSNSNPVYKQFNTIEELQNFVTQVYDYIKKTLNEGWMTKNAINWKDYELD